MIRGIVRNLAVEPLVVREDPMGDMIHIEGVRKIIFGCGSSGSIVPECKSIGASRVLLVMDRALSETDIGSRVQEMFQKTKVKAVPYLEVTPEPSPALANAGAALAKHEKIQCVVGIGGGSSIDAAKAIAMLVKNEGKAEDYIGLGLVKRPGLPTIMVPTTAGTGSEVTFTSVFTMRETKTKGGINSPFLYPHTAILDPELTLGLPREVTAYTGMDALTHAVESFTSLCSHFTSEPLSFTAIELVAANLRGAVFNGGEIKFREKMMRASYLAGLGLAMSGVGAVHALAYPLGAFFDVPHGIANAVMLPYVLEYNYPGALYKFARIAEAMGVGPNGCSEREKAASVVKAVRELALDIGIPLTLKDLHIPANSIPTMAQAAMNVTRPLMNNPRPVTASVAEDIYKRAFEGE